MDWCSPIFTAIPSDGTTRRSVGAAPLKMAGLPYVDIYSARHWLATELAAAGASDEERTAIMGHTDIHTTSVYTHWRERRLAETLDAALPDLRDGQ